MTELEANSCWYFLSMHRSVIESKWWEPQRSTETHFCDNCVPALWGCGGRGLCWNDWSQECWEETGTNRKLPLRHVWDRDQVSLCNAGALALWKTTDSYQSLGWTFIYLFVLHFEQHIEAAGRVFDYLSLKVMISNILPTLLFFCWPWWWKIRTLLLMIFSFWS